jgi:glucosamine--fructose-6-phosphate aminotransferase (isomerizing)
MIDLKDTVLLGISQSGASSEVIEAAAWARSRGAKVVALTNFPDAPLTEGLPVDQVLLMDAGEEQAVPATKTFTASLAWLLALTLVPHLERLRNLQGCMERRLNHDHQADVRSLAGATSFYFVGEGVTASLAREGALKFREMLSVASISLETSDLLHGSVAALDERSAVIGLAADGVGTSVLQQARRAWEARGARCLCFTSEDDPEDKADLGGSLAPAFPLLAALSLQKIALGLALHAGIDPDRPIGLEKVTETVVPKLASHGE